MALFFGLSSKNNSNAKPEDKKDASAKEVRQQLLNNEEMLMKRQTYFETRIQHELVNARKFGFAGNRKMAIGPLKRKKIYEKQMEQADDAVTTLTYLREALQNDCAYGKLSTIIEAMGKAMDSSQLDVDKMDEFISSIQEEDLLAELEDLVKQDNDDGNKPTDIPTTKQKPTEEIAAEEEET